MTGREITTRSDRRELRDGRWELPQFMENLKLLEENKRTEGYHSFELNDSLYSYIWGRMTASGGSLSERGSLGEDLGSAIIAKLGWEEIQPHAFDRTGPGREVYRHGTDNLFRHSTTKEPYLFELRWWKDADMAAEAAFREVLDRRKREQWHQQWGKISGAYIAIVDLHMTSKYGRIYVKRVW